MYRSDPVYAVLLRIEERSVVGISGNQPVRSSGGMVQVRIGQKKSGKVPVRSPGGWCLVRIGCDYGGKIPVRSSVGRNPDPHKAWLW